jgi:hypothetical protein
MFINLLSTTRVLNAWPKKIAHSHHTAKPRMAALKKSGLSLIFPVRSLRVFGTNLKIDGA